MVEDGPALFLTGYTPRYQPDIVLHPVTGQPANLHAGGNFRVAEAMVDGRFRAFFDGHSRDDHPQLGVWEKPALLLGFGGHHTAIIAKGSVKT